MSAETPLSDEYVALRSRPDTDLCMTNLQTFLSAAIRASGWPQAHLAESAGMSAKHVSQMLTGRVEGTLTAWQSLLDAAEVSFSAPVPTSQVRDWPACATYPNLGCVCRGALQSNKATCTRKRTGDRRQSLT